MGNRKINHITISTIFNFTQPIITKFPRNTIDIQYVQQNMGKVVIGGLLYPITQKGKDDDGTEFENTDIDKESYHSIHLFGDDGIDNTPPFIIDGILCSEVEDKIDEEENEGDDSQQLDKNIKIMIERIKSKLKN